MLRKTACDSAEHRRPCAPTPPKLSFEKGGASVLADGYLAAGTLSREEVQFIFRWGALLQLVDDLQDIRQDGGEHSLTIFTQVAGAFDWMS